MDRKPMMKCGHTAQGEDSKTGKPCCVICCGISEGWDIPASEPDLTGRVAKCTSCGQERPSSTQMPFFEYRPDKDYDIFYNGCRGWE